MTSSVHSPDTCFRHLRLRQVPRRPTRRAFRWRSGTARRHVCTPSGPLMSPRLRPEPPAGWQPRQSRQRRSVSSKVRALHEQWLRPQPLFALPLLAAVGPSSMTNMPRGQPRRPRALYAATRVEFAASGRHRSVQGNPSQLMRRYRQASCHRWHPQRETEDESWKRGSVL
jgi:hypothetical protein